MHCALWWGDQTGRHWPMPAKNSGNFAQLKHKCLVEICKAWAANFSHTYIHTHTHARACAGNCKVCKLPDWWRKLAAVHQLAQPFITAIHALEADKALLSQADDAPAFLRVHPNYDALEAHVTKWAANGELTQALRKDVVSTFKARCLKHYHPAQPAAFILDPINFEQQGN
eukprot:1156729-Pelagomonas_calceolata.AAC.1